MSMSARLGAKLVGRCIGKAFERNGSDGRMDLCVGEITRFDGCAT